MESDFCAPDSGIGCSDAVVGGVIVGEQATANGEQLLIVDTGQDRLRTFVGVDAPEVADGAHVFLRLMWIDETTSHGRWVMRSSGSRARITLCTMSDLTPDGSDDVYVAPPDVHIGAISALGDLKDLHDGTATRSGDSVRRMLVVSPTSLAEDED